MSFTRRDFLKTAVLGTAGLGLGALTGRSARAADPPLVRVVQVTCAGAVTPTGASAEAVLAMVRRGLAEITGCPTPAAAWARFLKPTDVVGLKINTQGAPLLQTHREVALAVAATLGEAGLPPDQVIVWDRAQADMEKAGWTLADEAGKLRVLAGDAVGHDGAYYCDSDPPSADGSRRSCFNKILTQRTQRLVNLPVLRHLSGCGFGMALENLALGTCDNVARAQGETYAQLIPTLFAQPPLQRRLTLVIADALRPQYAGGPQGNADLQWDYSSLIFALGQVSADAVGLAILDAKRQECGLPPLAQTADKPDYLAAAAAVGLGIADLAKIRWDKVEV